MVGFVTDIETVADSLGYHFDYGKRNWQNLLRSDKMSDKIYFLLDPLTITPTTNEYGVVTSSQGRSNFLLAVKSNLDNVVHKQKGQDRATGKYVKNIEPLLNDALDNIQTAFGCGGFNFKVTEIVDIYNYLDANLDGIIVTFTIDNDK